MLFVDFPPGVRRRRGGLAHAAGYISINVNGALVTAAMRVCVRVGRGSTWSRRFGVVPSIAARTWAAGAVVVVMALLLVIPWASGAALVVMAVGLAVVAMGGSFIVRAAVAATL